MKEEFLQEQPPITHPEVAFLEPENEQIGFCNCENAEQLTPYEGEEITESILESATGGSENSASERSDADHGTVFSGSERSEQEKGSPPPTSTNRKTPLQKQKRNPYIRHTRACRVAVYRTPQDKVPLDYAESCSTHGATWRTLAIGILILLAVGGMLWHCCFSCNKTERKRKKKP